MHREKPCNKETEFLETLKASLKLNIIKVYQYLLITVKYDIISLYERGC